MLPQNGIARAYAAFNQRNIEGGDVLSDSQVYHIQTIANGRIERINLKEKDASAACAHRDISPA